MNVAVVAPLPPIKGGIAAHSQNVLNALRATGVSAMPFTWDRQYPRVLYRSSESDPGGRGSEAPRVLHWAQPWGWRQLGGEIGSTADLLFMPWVTPFHAPVLATLMKTSGLPSSILVHNAKPHEWFPLTPTLTRLVLEDAVKLIAHSQTVVDDLRAFGVSTPAVVVPHPPNIKLEPTPVPVSPATKLLFAGFVRPYKGLDLLVEALANLPPEYELTVAGEFWQGSTEIRDSISRLGLAGRVTIIDRYVDDQELRDLFAIHHLVVAPYRSATQSGIIPLAFAAGRPVVATTVGGLAEAVTDHFNGILSDPHPGSIAEAILEATAEYETLAIGAASTQWSWNNVAEAILEAVPASD